MDQTKSIKLQKKSLESAEERRARLDKNNEKARAKSRTETEQKKKILFDVPDSELTLSLANGCNITTSFAQAFQHANDIHSRHYE